MKYFKVFNTESEYLAYISSKDFISPNVSTLRDCTNTWITVEIHKYEDDYLTFRALESGTFSLSANDVQYSLDNGETWSTLTAGSSTPTVNSGDTVLWKASNLTATSGVGIGTFSSTGDFEVEGNLLSLVYGDDFENQVPSTSSNKYYFTNLFSGNTNVINAENLVIVGQSLPDEYCRQMFHSCSNLEKIPRVLSASTIGNSTYRAMFNRCSKITTAPSIYATSIYENSMAWMFENCTSLTTPMEELSATTTYAACYQGMFKDCTSLLYTPKLPALRIGWSSYKEMFNGCTSLTAITQLSMEETSKESCMHMFRGCTSLTSVPDLYVIKFNGQFGSSLSYMFAGCTSLVTAPALPATNLKSNTTTNEYGVYKGMFSGCTSLTTAPALPATILSSNCYQEMFKGCTALITVPSTLPATSLTGGCYECMFENCSSLTTAPELPATTLANNCYYQMFKNCISLTTAPSVLPAATVSNKAYYEMFNQCTSLTTAPSISATSFGSESCRSMFYGCTSLTTTQATLSATTLGFQCCRGMYVNCTSLTTAPELLATTLADSCYYDMFNGCSALTTAQSVLPATTLEANCYHQMFYNCKSLVTAPTLSAETVAASACTDMFNGCTALTTVQSELPATTMADYCYHRMFSGCTNLTTAPELPATTLASYCYNQMFSNCKSLTTAPNVLPATTLASYCYNQMFANCTSLTTAPELPARTLVGGCYYQMFKDCNKLNYIKCLATDISATDCTYQWVYHVKSISGTFVKYASMSNWTSSDVNNPKNSKGIPSTWTVVDYSDVHVTGVTISSTAETITKGGSVTLTATVTPNDAYDKVVTWSTSDSTVATVNDGVVTAVGCGNAIITVTTHDGGYTAQCTTTVENPVTSVTLNSNVTYILTGETYQLVATVSPSDACGDKSVSWSSSDNNIATVSNNGLVTAVSTGSAVITVTTTVGSYTATCAVEVSEPVAVTGVTLDKATLDLVEYQTWQLVATVLPNDATTKDVIWSSNNANVATVDSNGIVSAVTTGSATITVTTVDGGYTASCEVTVSEQSYTTISIEGASVVSAETCEYRAVCDNVEDVTSSATWSITNGSQYATIDSSNGHVTILNGANESSVTIQVVYGNLTGTSTVTLTYVSGATSETETETTTDIGGNATTVTTTVTEYEDGSSVKVIETIVTDVNGDLVGSSESTKATNADGSYNGTTTNYDANGDPTDGTNVTGDTDGNVSTQSVEYDESGNTVVTGYDIDTSESESGKTFNHDGVNTDYYAFDVTHGFVLDFDFTIDFSNQPPNQHQGHHNILNAKRADPSPYYGFQLRHSQTNGFIQLGTQFSGSTNINTSILPASTTGSVGSYSLRIVYDPNSSGNKFVCTNMATGDEIYSSTGIFPDLEELKYLRITIGNATDGNGNPFRYSNITVSKFELKKLKYVANPTITCEDNEVSISCSTVGASVYYRLNLHGDYSAYTTPITITADTVVQAYATYSGDTSDIIREDCEYDNGVKKPVIVCDGEHITITCETVGATIYYRLNETGSYTAYTTTLEITADTIVEAYSELNGETSDTVKETCIYVEGVSEPVINFDGEIILLSCDTIGADIYYRLNESGSYVKYLSSIKITADTIIESYAKLLDKTSDTVRQSCTYNPVHDYSKDYLTFRVISAGTVVWKAVGGGHNRNIQYSLNDGEWTTLTATTGGSSIEVEVNDVIRFKGDNTAYAKDKNNYSGFYEGTAKYDVEGNIMSLIYNDNFSGQTSLTANWALSNVFNHSNAVSAKDLVMPATTLKSDCYRATFANSYSLTETPKILPATTLANSCYYYMFDNCRSLTTAPELPATTMASKCYFGMFHSETANSINYIKCLATPSTANTQNWLQLGTSSNYSVASTGTFVKKSGTTWPNGVSGIPTGWTVEDAT